MMKRDKLIRLCGILFFCAFFSFHIWQIEKEWSNLNLIAKINGGLISATIVLFISAYFIRTTAVSISRGFWEKVFPLFCGALPFLVYHSGHVLKMTPKVDVLYPISQLLFGFYKHPLLSWNIFSMTLVITGNLLTLVGIFYIKKSFSIMVEAREPVYFGVYKYIRHPIYLGEILAIVGTSVFRFSVINIFFTILFITGQIVRASLEERKLSETFESYAEYKDATGAFFPKIKL